MIRRVGLRSVTGLVAAVLGLPLGFSAAPSFSSLARRLSFPTGKPIVLFQFTSYR